jgi:hypothetical protein
VHRAEEEIPGVAGEELAEPHLPVAHVVDLEPELDRKALPLCVENRVAVRVEVVDAALCLVLERPELARLAEVVDVLGEAELVHPAVGCRP